MTTQVHKTVLLLAVTALCCSFPAWPQYSGLEKPVRFSLSGDTFEASPGETIHLTLHGEVLKDWHVYANPKGPGTGLPLVVDLEGPPGSRVKIDYPKAERFDIPDLNEWVYAWEDDFAIPLALTLPSQGFEKRSYIVKVKMDGLACEKACIPIREELSFVLNIQTEAGASSFLQNPSVESPSEPPEGQSPGTQKNIFVYIFLGFLAGIFLNLMPCVLPVLSLKVLSVVSLGKERALKAALFYSLGTWLVFALLAGLMAFSGLMWGQQFQSSGFLIGLGTLVVFFILSLLDLFHFGVLAKTASRFGVSEGGYGEDFFKGILATLLATPCSGPFLGGTLFWASQQSPVTILSVYSSVGLGMASPFFLVVTIPALKKWLPKPGPWMIHFKQGSAFLMMGTLVYLLYLLEAEGRLPALALFIFTAFCGWLFSISHGKGIRLASLILLLGGFVVWNGTSLSAVKRIPLENAFSLEKLEKAAREGQTVVVDFTADWCPNCKVNEKWVLASPEVQNAFKKAGVLFLVADITRKNPEAEAELKRLGGYAIPFLAVYPFGNPAKVKTIRDVYTKKAFLAFFNDYEA